MNFIKTKIFSILFAISVIGNVYFLLGKGIQVTTNNISNSTSNSYANSGSLSIGYIGGDARGKWTIKETDWLTSDEAITFLNSLSPAQYCFVKVVTKERYGRGYKIYYPDLTQENSAATKTVKTINGEKQK